MLRCVQCVVLLGSLWLISPRTMVADDKPPAPEPKLEKFHGRWSTSREVREGEKVRHSQLVLDFRGRELTYYTEED
jgi:hypothetical protein